MVSLTALTQLACLLWAASVLAQNSSAPPTLTLSTAIPTATAPTSSDLPSQVSLPPKQVWCPSEIFCPGQVGNIAVVCFVTDSDGFLFQLLQTVNIAHLFPDDKTFVDKVMDQLLASVF
jgi:alpha,alpha-trehalase